MYIVIGEILAERKVKGSVILGYLKYIKRTWGQLGLDECTDFIGLDYDHFEEKRWHDIEQLDKVIQWIGDNKGSKYIERAGNYTVKDLGILSYLVKFASIESLLKKAPKSYHDAYNYGDVEIDIGEKEAVIKMKDVIHGDYSCNGWLGAFKGMMEMTHTTGTVKEVQCQKESASHCEFLMKWD